MRVEICSRSGEPEPDQPSLIGPCGWSHAEMVALFRTIREEPERWIEAQEQTRLRAWLVANDVHPTPGEGAEPVSPGNRR
jgi:hypothetical protein